jgi:hypothetical protein
MIRKQAGLERVLIFLTGLREYRCQDCDQKFRAADRRKRPRPANKKAAGAGFPEPVSGIPTRAAENSNFASTPAC